MLIKLVGFWCCWALQELPLPTVAPAQVQELVAPAEPTSVPMLTVTPRNVIPEYEEEAILIPQGAQLEVPTPGEIQVPDAGLVMPQVRMLNELPTIGSLFSAEARAEATQQNSSGDDPFLQAMMEVVARDNPGLSPDDVRKFAMQVSEIRRAQSGARPANHTEPQDSDRRDQPHNNQPHNNDQQFSRNDDRDPQPRRPFQPQAVEQQHPNPPIYQPHPTPDDHQRVFSFFGLGDSRQVPPGQGPQGNGPQGVSPQGYPGAYGAPTQPMHGYGQAPSPFPTPQPQHPQPQHPSPDQHYVQALRNAAKQLDQAAAELEDRRAYDLADQMRSQAQQLRQNAREREQRSQHDQGRSN